MGMVTEFRWADTDEVIVSGSVVPFDPYTITAGSGYTYLQRPIYAILVESAHAETWTYWKVGGGAVLPSVAGYDNTNSTAFTVVGPAKYGGHDMSYEDSMRYWSAYSIRHSQASPVPHEIGDRADMNYRIGCPDASYPPDVYQVAINAYFTDDWTVGPQPSFKFEFVLASESAGGDASNPLWQPSPLGSLVRGHMHPLGV